MVKFTLKATVEHRDRKNKTYAVTFEADDPKISGSLIIDYSDDPESNHKDDTYSVTLNVPMEETTTEPTTDPTA